jgi:CheY-like chemotaxis protein/anti-sigma regulatory factor (Ser/Thr protein kinase)
MLLQDNKIISPCGELTAMGVVIQMFLMSISTSYDSLESYRVRIQLKEELQEAREKQEQLEQFVRHRHHQMMDEKIQKPTIGLVMVSEYRYQEVENSLSPCDYHVVRIEDSLDGFAILLHPKPVNLLVLDVRDNPRQGLDSLKQLRNLIPKEIMPVILISETGQENYIGEGLDNGASDFLTMPFKYWEFTTRVKNLVHLSVSSEKLLASQLMFLQAQIKPHFLFNTLSVLSSMAEVNPPMTKQLILDLADYLRGGIDFESSTGIIRLSKEIEIVRAYVSIEQARFRNRIDTEFYLEGDLEVEVPLLAIQPLVENAIRHGILPKNERGKILVSVVNDGHRVVIEVRDDGIGMVPEEVERIKHQAVVSESGIGLSNIQRRLQILFGASLSIESVQGEGTTVSFSILARKGVRVDESAGC